MDLRGWSVEQIEHLPEGAFGRRYLVSASPYGSGSTSQFDISEVVYPSRCFLWGVGLRRLDVGSAVTWVRIALGTVLPTSEAEMMGLPPLIHGWGAHGAEPRAIYIRGDTGQVWVPVRAVINTGYKRLVVGCFLVASATLGVEVVTIVSAVPTEVPDWLFSGRAISP